MVRIFSLPDIHAKLGVLDDVLERLLSGRVAEIEASPEEPARTARIVANRDLPPKAGLSTPAGQGRLLHDLANIELQAMELAVRTLIDFPDAPEAFRQELAQIARSEGEHLAMCAESLDQLGFQFGEWPVHAGLWWAVKPEDDLIERILKVHRHMEGSGLDAGEAILTRLSGVDNRLVRAAVARIVREEVGHVEFGSRWYREVCRLERRDPADEFCLRMPGIAAVSPRNEKIAVELRRAAGFDEAELRFLTELQTNRPAPQTSPRQPHHQK